MAEGSAQTRWGSLQCSKNPVTGLRGREMVREEKNGVCFFVVEMYAVGKIKSEHFALLPIGRKWVMSSSAKRKVRQKSKTKVWSKTQLKTELDLVTKTGSKNILRPNFGLRLLS